MKYYYQLFNPDPSFVIMKPDFAFCLKNRILELSDEDQKRDLSSDEILEALGELAGQSFYSIYGTLQTFEAYSGMKLLGIHIFTEKKEYVGSVRVEIEFVPEFHVSKWDLNDSKYLEGNHE